MSAAPKGKVVQWMEERTQGAPIGVDPGAFDPRFVRDILARMRLVFTDDDAEHRWFHVDARGWENVPKAPALFVSNHSGGTSIPDAWGFGFAWHTHFGVRRPIHTLAHEMIFSIPPVGRFFARGGVLRAQPQLGEKVLTEWRRDLLVMPGGDVDVWRPYRERYKVKFAGRKGYARLALKARVPIVPVANAGAHSTLRVLTDGEPIARLLGFPKLFRASIFPVHLSIPWGLAIGPWPHLPPPSRLKYRFGKPVLPEGGFCAPGEEPSPERVAAYDARVRAAVQALLDDLAREEEAEREARRSHDHARRLEPRTRTYERTGANGWIATTTL
jgi:1-acyl-sn-glycerol-3-phosphate acyltransferase